MQTTDQLADKLIHELKEKCDGIIIHFYKSCSSNSIYIKLDYGACSTIRISDHSIFNNDEYHYKYELRTDIKKSHMNIAEEKFYSYLYCARDINLLVNKIKRDRDKRMSYARYKKDMSKRKKYMENNKSKLFYDLCVQI